MSLSLVQSRALLGLNAAAVTVEVHLANGLPSFTLVGLADVEVKEARERVRSAIQNSGLEFPHNKRIIVNLAPADLPKDSGRFDLPIAIGILAASGQIDSSKLAGHEFAGELSLSGELRPIRGALAMSLALHDGKALTKLVLPPSSAEEAALVPDSHVYRAQHLLDVVSHFLPEAPNAAVSAPAPEPSTGWSRVHPVAMSIDGVPDRPRAIAPGRDAPISRARHPLSPKYRSLPSRRNPARPYRRWKRSLSRLDCRRIQFQRVKPHPWSLLRTNHRCPCLLRCRRRWSRCSPWMA